MANPGSISASPDEMRPSRKRPESRRSGDGGGSSLGTNLILTLLVAGLGVAGWFILNQHRLLESSQAQQTDAEARLVVLENRLRATDEVMSDSGEATNEKLGYWETEIRKVWDIAYRDNRGWIKENQAALATQGGKLDTLTSSLADANSVIGDQAELLSAQQAVLSQLEGATAALAKLNKSHTALAAKVRAAQTDGLAERVMRNEQGVAAIDAYRVQLNARLTELQKRMNALPAGPSPGP